MWAVVARRDAHPEVAARTFLEEQAHVVAGHDEVAVVDGVGADGVDGAAAHEVRLLVVVDDRGAPLVHPDQPRLGAIGEGQTSSAGWKMNTAVPGTSRRR